MSEAESCRIAQLEIGQDSLKGGQKITHDALDIMKNDIRDIKNLLTGVMGEEGLIQKVSKINKNVDGHNRKLVFVSGVLFASALFAKSILKFMGFDIG